MMHNGSRMKIGRGYIGSVGGKKGNVVGDFGWLYQGKCSMAYVMVGCCCAAACCMWIDAGLEFGVHLRKREFEDLNSIILHNTIQFGYKTQT